MDTNNTTNSNDDQELAKVLAGMNQQVAGGSTPTDEANGAAPVDSLVFEETAANTSSAAPLESNAADSFGSDASATTSDASQSGDTTPVLAPGFGDSPELESMKKSALEDLRPLVEKLDLPADEKFDTLLLLIRSTDDKSLLGAAHESARNITDETKRAQALLDVIKEIDYFSGHGPQPV